MGIHPLLPLVLGVVLVVVHLLLELVVDTGTGDSKVAKETLTDFPVTFKLCAAPRQWDASLFQQFGYEDDEKMFLGQSRYDPNTFGWAGHREDGGHFTVQEVLNATNIPWRRLVRRVEYDTDTVAGEDIAWPTVQQLHGCVTFDPRIHFTFQPGKELFILLSSELEYDVSVYVEDGASTAARMLKSKALSQAGADIRFEYKDGGQEIKKYLLSFTKTVGDSNNDEDQSYNCDQEFVRSRIETEMGEDVVPFWALRPEDDFSSVTTDTKLSPGQQMELWNLFDGTTDNDCKDPATTTTTVHRLAEYPARGKHEHSTLVLTFASEMRVVGGRSGPSLCYLLAAVFTVAWSCLALALLLATQMVITRCRGK